MNISILNPPHFIACTSIDGLVYYATIDYDIMKVRVKWSYYCCKHLDGYPQNIFSTNPLQIMKKT